VVYDSVKPDLLRNEAQAIVRGRMGEDGRFMADELLLNALRAMRTRFPGRRGLMLAEIGGNLVGLSLILSLYAAGAPTGEYAGGMIAGRRARGAERSRWQVCWLGSADPAAAVPQRRFLSELRRTALGDYIPTYLKVSAVWAGQEGSLLLWCALQALFAALATARPSEKARVLVPGDVFLNLITAFFVAVTALLSNPFARLDTCCCRDRD